ncbi:DUF2804 domain-containing protein [Vagococcus zengguangii]|uniref:DUF2804 domain-containing protein n=1 Tax=Vagococcus zengguangii TaxID=2571750 RepID=A0A4D7CWB4_9ENTE|nr:DUF2804 domain-containing protein [Vagococcus zengguangii]QCI86450.1 DUF2804 domain-containing protein [Vagococcus zengguangii]TLG81300.1 DUF2804 domain-containing protein [Vagococcus zengguangii]
MRNHEVTKQQPLLNEKGALNNPGWSRGLVQQYDRKQIKASTWRIKEWDYYLIHNDEYACCFTISDNAYLGLESVSLINFKERWEHTESLIIPLTMGKLNLPKTSKTGDVHFNNKRLNLSFTHQNGQRHINCQFKQFHGQKDFECELVLTETQPDSLVIATPWPNKPKAFYYNQKINNMTVTGHVKYGEQTITFEDKNNFATLDWGRGVWTYDNTWYWGNGNGIVNGKPFGFNLGYGFGDISAASENVVYYDGILNKLDDIEFIHQEDYLAPWTITSSDGRFEGTFEPIIDRSALTDVKIIKSDQHQVFGYLNARVILDNQEVIEVNELLCFFEKVHNKY